jgi:hypothetical protein
MIIINRAVRQRCCGDNKLKKQKHSPICFPCITSIRIERTGRIESTRREGDESLRALDGTVRPGSHQASRNAPMASTRAHGIQTAPWYGEWSLWKDQATSRD